MTTAALDPARGLAARGRVPWPAVVFGVAWGGSLLVLVLAGQPLPVVEVAIAGAYLALAALTVRLTEPAPFRRATEGRRRLWLQVAVVGACIALTGWTGLRFHEVPWAGPLPAWTPLTDGLRGIGDGLFGNGNVLANPVTYAVIPGVLLVALGARHRELGLGAGHRVGRTLLLWAAIPVAFLAVAVASGQLTAGRVVGRLVSNAMQNGFWEEFLLRGALQTRLRALLSPAWAVVLQALVFGAWHLGLGYTTTGGAGLLPALAITIVQQGAIGLAFGIVFERTRNLVAPSVAHVLANTMG